MSNIIPQRPHLNRGVWEHLEEREIREYAREFDQVWVVTGPVFGNHPARLPSGVTVPDACYKIMVEEERGQPRSLAFIIPQSVDGSEAAGSFLTSVSEIERETELDFFNDLPPQERHTLEANKARRMW